MHWALTFLLTGLLLALLTLSQRQAAGSATVNGHVEPTGTIYAADKATLVLDFSTSPAFGNEVRDEDGKFKFDLYVTLRLAGQPEVEPRNYSQGLWIAPKTDHFPFRFEIPHPLSVGKWVVNATIYEEMEHDRMKADMEPHSWEIDVFQRPPPEKSWFQLVEENSATIPAGIAVTAIGVIIGVLIKRRRTNQNHSTQNSAPLQEWETLVNEEVMYQSDIPISVSPSPTSLNDLEEITEDEVGNVTARVRDASNANALRSSWANLEGVATTTNISDHPVFWRFLDEHLLSNQRDDHFRHAISLVKTMLFVTNKFPKVNETVSSEARNRYLDLLLELARSVDVNLSSERFDALQILGHVLKPSDLFRKIWQIWRDIGLQIQSDDEYGRWVTALIPHMENQEKSALETIKEELQELINSPVKRISSRAFGMEAILGFR